MLKMGIVGLPNVGKSTLFNAITNSSVDAINYPFSTIKPNVGIVEVKDERLNKLAAIFNSKKVVPTAFEFIDIAGLISGASKGEGLGNAFLANIRETDAIAQVVRCFKNDNVLHVEGNIDAVRDVEIINLELIISDQNSVDKQLQKIGKKIEHIQDKEIKKKFILLTSIKKILMENKLINQFEWSDDEKKIIKTFNLLTSKPFIYIANIAENDILNGKKNSQVKKLQVYAKKQNIMTIQLSVDFEYQLSKLDQETQKLFMEEYKLKESGLNKLIFQSYKLLGLKTFFTAGVKETRAWTFKENALAPECAGIIHTDFQTGFIKAEVYGYDDIIKYRNEKALKEAGKIRLEGKNYHVNDGDICFFKYNI